MKRNDQIDPDKGLKHSQVRVGGTRHRVSEQSDIIIPAHREFCELGDTVQALMADGLARRTAARSLALNPSLVGSRKVAIKRALKASMFVQRFRNKEEILVSLGRLKTPEGKPLPLDTLDELATIEDECHRNELLSGLEAGRWTSANLRDKKRDFKGLNQRAGGPSIEAPKCLIDWIDQIGKWSSDWIKHDEKAWSRNAESFDNSLSNPERFTLKARIVKAQYLLNQMAERAEVLETRLAEVEARFRKRSSESQK